MATKDGPGGEADPAVGADERADGRTDERTDPDGATLEVRVLAIGPLADGRWLGRGRLADGSAVDFVTDRLAAERIADTLADGRDAIALIRPRQVLA